MVKRRDARITLRLPEPLKKQIEAFAEADRRSTADWCLVALQAAVAKREASKGKR